MPLKKAKIKGYGDKYSVNSNGQVMSKGKVMKPRKDASGYTRVNLKHKGESKTVRVHLLVSRAFQKVGKKQVGHMNGNKEDSSLRNLKPQTPSENTQHAHDTGLYGRYSVRKHLRKGKNKVSVVKTHKRKR